MVETKMNEYECTGDFWLSSINESGKHPTEFLNWDIAGAKSKRDNRKAVIIPGTEWVEGTVSHAYGISLVLLRKLKKSLGKQAQWSWSTRDGIPSISYVLDEGVRGRKAAGIVKGERLKWS